ncbi:uncharacterized protein LOC126679004 [Mercurialis annua]|uniref:uncharacterized protein LOC126679004 n=1 Tax=Mercurialis annua TaxID=3986 RepID=UPI00215E8A1D|nr:uncharacterized protein LOC126679004 [Mercurialis annua]
MGITAMTKHKSTNENWGMGLLLVFFSEDATATATSATPATILDKANTTPSPTSNKTTKTIKRTNSNNPILTKTQSTISICALLLFLTLLLFTLSTFEPTINNSTNTLKTPRRLLPDGFSGDRIITHQRILTKSKNSWFSWKIKNGNDKKSGVLNSFALQGMGRLYLRGTKAMSDLVVGHVVEDTNEDEFRVYLRLLHRSGITAKADTVFIFDSSSLASRFEGLIREENDSFLKLVQHYKELNGTSRDSVSVALRFDVTQFVKHGSKEMAEPIWGRKVRVNSYNYSESVEGSGSELTRLSYGSVVGFETSELDPENSLAGFLEHVPMSLKRWACYPMLLGRVRRNFKHVMLVDVKKMVLLSDPLSRVRNQSPESVYITTKQEMSSSTKHGKRNSDKTQSHSQVNSAILMGGTRGIRRFSSAMLTEIARAAMQHKKKSSVTESSIISQLVSNKHILKNVDLITSAESIPEANSLTESNSALWDHYKIIQRGNVNHDVNSIIMKHICSCEVDSSVYRDC